MSATLRSASSLLALGIVLALCACGSKVKKIAVTGSASWNGEPIVEYGDIILHPDDNASMPDAGKIVNGRFQVMTTPGRKKVQIFYAPEKPVPAGVMGQREREQKIPIEYNHETTLIIEVKEGQKNEFDFHLPLARQGNSAK